MSALDQFAVLLFEEAKRFLEKGSSERTATDKAAYFHASIIMGFCSLEAHINAIADDFLTRTDLSLHDKSVLSEKRVEFAEGRFKLSDNLQIYRLEDRLLYLCERFSKRPLDRTTAYWGKFKAALALRNNLSHPKDPPVTITQRSVESALKTILEILNVLYRKIYKRSNPIARRGLHSPLTF